MGLFFLAILTLFLPSCAGANLRKLAEASEMQHALDLNHVAPIENNVDFGKLLPTAIVEYQKPKLSDRVSANVKSFNADFEQIAATTHKPKDFIVNGKTKKESLFAIVNRLQTYPLHKISQISISRLLLLEVERGRRWNMDQILHKRLGTGMKLKRSEEEEAMIPKDSIAPVVESLVGRDNQMITDGKKVMAFCIVLRRSDGKPLVAKRVPVPGKQQDDNLYFAEEKDVEMVIISSSNQAKSNWITVKGGRNNDESAEQAALRETLEECGFAATIRSRLEDKVVVKEKKKPDDKEEKSLWQTFVMDGGVGTGPEYGMEGGEEVGKQYESFAEDGRLRGLLPFDDAVKVIRNNDPVMAENVERVKALFGQRQTAANAQLAKTKLVIPKQD